MISFFPKSSWYALKIGVRPRTLLLGVGPVLLGNSLGISRSSEFGWIQVFVILATLMLVVTMQAAANLVNDVKDADSGVDNDSRLGPLRVVQSGLVSKKVAVDAYRLLLGIGLVIAGLLTIRGGWPALSIGLASCLAAYLYTGGPAPLSYLGLGELVAFIFFGPVAVMSTAYLHDLAWRPDQFIWSIGPGLLAASVMALNNLRDRRGDALVGKQTLAVRLPDYLSEKMPWVLVQLSLGFLLCLFFAHSVWLFGLLLCLLMLSALEKQLKPLIFPRAESLNRALKYTSLFSFIYNVIASLVVSL